MLCENKRAIWSPKEFMWSINRLTSTTYCPSSNSHLSHARILHHSVSIRRTQSTQTNSACYPDAHATSPCMTFAVVLHSVQELFSHISGKSTDDVETMYERSIDAKVLQKVSRRLVLSRWERHTH